ncbi:helix-turn-helix domain-containing protein [Corynebacterium sp. UBA2622]|uniref:helix-turn-helix domain-containing protein n=1 Tax=Corynebacterium sp. UBA2622 TaxID=1946393 RepID=UPI0025C56163|nr:helix-turn-helix transcriptional regulator [Corynebacterium sp. UBA2622]
MSGPRNKTGKPASEDPLLLTLGEQIARTRREAGRLQQEVADAAGVSRSTLHTIEHGGAGVRWEKVAAVASALGLGIVFEPRQ